MKTCRQNRPLFTRIGPVGFILLYALAFSVLSGCGTKIGTNRIGYEQAYRQINQNALSGKQISTASRKVLARYNLDSAYKSDPKAALKRLRQQARSDNRRDLLFALAELNYHSAGGPVKDRKNTFWEESRQYYLHAALFAYFYLFESGLDEPPDHYKREFRWACDIYNISLAKALSDESGHLVFNETTRDLPDGRLSLEISPGQFPWNPETDAGIVLAADEMEIFGLSLRNREAGIGVPFIVIREHEARFALKKSTPGTLFLNVEGGLNALYSGSLTGQLTVFSPLIESRVPVEDDKIPLEMDLSLPLAHTLNQQLLWDVGLKEFFTGKNRFETGLYLLTPYVPGKIPVVLVHGTFSNPVAWAELSNTLLADPVIREKFHFWYYLYDSNRPIVLSALSLRGALRKTVVEIDPEGNDLALREMVVIGHSQGGVLTKLTATDTEDRVIREVAGKGLDELDLSEDKRLLVERTAVFSALPFVKRVVFIATPHRGSRLVTGWVQNLVRKVVTVSAETLNLSSNLAEAIPEENIPESWQYNQAPTSIDSMSPDNPALLALSRIPPAPGVRSHSIIAVQGKEDPAKGSDGVVDYKSAHLDYTDSELIVQPGDHSVQWHPLAIEEVRRILHLHLTESKRVGRARATGQ